MIEKLNGTTETVNFTLASNIRLYHNNSAEDFPLHWHVPGEIICPIQNTYNVTVADEILYLKPHDNCSSAQGNCTALQLQRRASGTF